MPPAAVSGGPGIVSARSPANKKAPKSHRSGSPAKGNKSSRKKGKTPRAKPTGAGDALTNEAATLLAEVLKVSTAASSSSGVEDETEAQAKALREQGKYDDAERLYRQVLAKRRTELGDRHASTVSTLDQLGATLYMKGDLVGAEELLLEALEARRATLGDSHPDTVASVSSSGMLLKDKGDLSRAEPLLREAVAAMRETIGERHPDALICMANLGVLLKDKGDLEAAEPLLRDALQAMRETLGDAHPATLVNIVQLGLVLMAKKDHAAAEGLLVEALQVRPARRPLDLARPCPPILLHVRTHHAVASFPSLPSRLPIPAPPLTAAPSRLSTAPRRAAITLATRTRRRLPRSHTWRRCTRPRRMWKQRCRCTRRCSRASRRPTTR